MNDEGVKALVQAVVFQAASDYRKATKRLKKNPKSYSAEAMVYETEKFFKSDWFEAMTGFDGRSILKRLQNGDNINQKQASASRMN